jgi:hypothetical protein
MSVQNIIDKAQQIEIDRRRIVGQTMSRSQRIKTAERATAQPWKFKITPPGSLPWTASRGFIEVINLNDRAAEYQISLSNSVGTRYITSYMGELTQGQLNGLEIQSVGTSSFVVTGLPSVSSSTVVFAKGDLIQPENSRYPYAVVNTVVRGLTTTTSVTLHRPIITSEGVTLSGQGLAVGNSCTWRVIVSGLPTFQLIPMQQVQYTGDFELIERII